MIQKAKYNYFVEVYVTTHVCLLQSIVYGLIFIDVMLISY